MANDLELRVSRLEHAKPLSGVLWAEGEDKRSVWIEGDLHHAREGETMAELCERLCQERGGGRYILCTREDLLVL